MAAVESFYHAFNSRNLDLIGALWAPVEPTRLLNPVGGIVEGKKAAVEKYRRLFASPKTLSVTFSDILVHQMEMAVLFVGRERIVAGTLVIPVRTSRLFYRFDVGWRQLHHHGSVDDPTLLSEYQGAMIS